MVCAEAICSSLHGPHAERALVRPVLGLLGCAEIFTKERDCRRKVAWLDVKVTSQGGGIREVLVCWLLQCTKVKMLRR